MSILSKIKPNKVSAQYEKQSHFMYSVPKAGKTTTMFEILGQKCLFLATEVGYLSIPDIHAVDINSISDLKELIWELQDMKDAGQELPYTCVCIDTVDNLEILLQKYVCGQAGVANMGDVGHGKLYAEFDKVLIGIMNDFKNLGLGIHYISHSKLKKIEDKLNGVEYEKYFPSISERMQKILLADCYFISFIFNKVNVEEKTEQRIMCFRDTTQFSAGSRYRHLAPYIPLSATAFKGAVEEAIKKEEELKAGSTTKEANIHTKTKLDFNSIMARGSELGAKFQAANQIDKLMDAVTEILGTDENGKPRMFNQLKESQVEIANVLVMKLEKLAKELGI